jgi:hypothetical protein
MNKNLNVKIIKGSQLQIDDRVFIPFKTKPYENPIYYPAADFTSLHQLGTIQQYFR